MLVYLLLLLLLCLLVSAQEDSTGDSSDDRRFSKTDKASRDYYDILMCSRKCTNEEFKRNYRNLALKYHPDKHGAHVSEEQRQEMHAEFLKVQLAYETLIDEQKRLQYDLSIEGVQYDIREDQELDRYHSRDFNLLMKTKGNGVSGKMFFSAKFSKPPIIDLVIHIDVDLMSIGEEQMISKKYWRKVQCAVCGGNGGLNGECTTCTLCEGKGYALHSFKYTSKNKKRSFEQWTETTCGSCNGKGCHPVGKCTKCDGVGTHMEELEIHVVIPPFPHHGWNIFTEEGGHQEGSYVIHNRI